MFSTGPIDGEEYLGRHSMTVSSLLAYCIATQCTDCRFAIDAEDYLLTSSCSQVFDHSRDYESSWPLFLHADCRHHAESNVQHVQDCEQLLAWCVLHETSAGHDVRELWFFVWLSVMWIVCGSGSHAAAAPVLETCECELVRGLLRCIRTDRNTLASGIPLFLSWFEYSTRIITPQHQIKC